MKASSLLRIGDKIRQLRENKEWTQKQLAEASQINEVQIRRYENNQSLPRDAQLIKIANALGVDKDEFFKETVYRVSHNINIDNLKKKSVNPLSFSDSRELIKLMKEKTENLSKSFETRIQGELEFIQTFIEDKKDNAVEVDRIFDLLWYYNRLEDDEKIALIYLLQIFTLTNTLGKNKVLEFSEIVFGNSDFRKEE